MFAKLLLNSANIIARYPLRSSLSFSMAVDLGSMRKAYNDPNHSLNDADFKTRCPFDIFTDWFQTAKQTCESFTEVNSVCLATSSKDGQPSARMVLLKSYSNDGFTIFTNYCSRKGKEIEENPKVALLFHWDILNRQIRIEGHAERIDNQESEEYFHQRPRNSQLSARISQQSCPVLDRETLVKLQKEEDKKFPEIIPKPDFWGGYKIIPDRFEFWQGQSDRLHDRFQFDRNDTSWTVKRLQP